MVTKNNTIIRKNVGQLPRDCHRNIPPLICKYSNLMGLEQSVNALQSAILTTPTHTFNGIFQPNLDSFDTHDW